MEIKPKKLSIYQMFGYEERGLKGIPLEQMCREVYPLCWEFIEDMLDTAYSDGPVYFKSSPFSDKHVLSIFTTFGNKIAPTGDYTSSLLFEKNILVDSEDFASFSSEKLEDYYHTLISKYDGKNLERLAVYHVLYHSGEKIIVDAYSSWEED